MKFLLLMLLIYTVNSQINVITYPNIPTYSGNLYCVQLNNDGTEVYISIYENGPKIIHLNVTDPANNYKIGQYKSPNQIYAFYKMYIIKDYLIGTGLGENAKLFNLTTYQPIGSFGWISYFVNGFPILHKNIYVFSDDSARIFYFDMNVFPSGPPVYVFNNTSAAITVMSQSFDDQLVCVSYETLSQVRIFDVETWTMLNVIQVPSGGVHSTAWSLDSRFLLVFPYAYPYFLVYDRNSNWSLHTNVSTGYYYVKKCFVYNETNVVLCNSQYNKLLFSINLYDFYLNVVIQSFQGERYYVSQNNKVFSYKRTTAYLAWFYKINPYCSGIYFYNIQAKNCQPCDPNCLTCLNSTLCSVCVANYTFFNGTCHPCGSNELYNSSTKLCDDFSIFCTGDQYFSIPALACVQCLQHCGKCLSTTTCQYCASNYSFVNGTCVACGSNELYNSSTKLCDDVSTFCTGDQYFSIPLLTCVQCQANCIKCASTSQCSVCQSNFTLVNGACQLCGIGKFYNSTTFLCDSCLTNCEFCTQASTCNRCSANYIFTDLPTLSCQLNSSNENYIAFCTSNCQSCESQSQCSVCAEGFSLTQNKKCMFCGENEVYDSQKDQCVVSPHTFYKQIMELTLQSKFLQETNKIPGNRILLQQVFSFFVNMDHLWLYLYHERKYGPFIEDFFASIRKLEQQKWSTVSEEFLSETFGLNWINLESKFNWKRNQTSWKYILLENSSSSFLENTLKFFILNFPLTLLICISFRIFYYLMSKFRLRNFMKEYSFNLFFITILMEGNIESFSYFFVFDCANLTSENHFQKGINFLTLNLFMVFTFYIFSWYFIIKFIEKSQSEYFFKEYHTNLSGLVHITLESNVLNFLLGASQILMMKNYANQLEALICIETGYSLVLLVSLASKKIYKMKYSGWLNVMTSFLRMSLIMTLSLDRDQLDGERNIFSKLEMIILIGYMYNWLVSILAGYFLILNDLRKYLVEKWWQKKLKRKNNTILQLNNQKYDSLGISLFYVNSKNTLRSFSSVSKLKKLEEQKKAVTFKVSQKQSVVGQQDKKSKQDQIQDQLNIEKDKKRNFKSKPAKYIRSNTLMMKIKSIGKVQEIQVDLAEKNQNENRYHSSTLKKLITKKFNNNQLN